MRYVLKSVSNSTRSEHDLTGILTIEVLVFSGRDGPLDETYVQRLTRYGVGLIKLAYSLTKLPAWDAIRDQTVVVDVQYDEPTEVMSAIVSLIGLEE